MNELYRPTLLTKTSFKLIEKNPIAPLAMQKWLRGQLEKSDWKNGAIGRLPAIKFP